MSRFFSDRARGMKASDIRELLELTQKPEIISLAGGLPNPAAFPADEISEICTEILKNDSHKCLQYCATEGIRPLRMALLDYMKDQLHVGGEVNNVIVTTGSQQALSLISSVLLNPGDLILTTAPSYVGGLGAFRMFQAEMEAVDQDDGGLVVDSLSEKLASLKAEGRKPKMIYVVPTFQNPAGVTMSEKRREDMLELAIEYDVLILEDDPYSRLRFEGEDVRPVKYFDYESRVIFLGTMSKLLSPGLRVAWIHAPKDLARKFAIAKQSADLCSTTFSQYIAYEFMDRGLLMPHIEKIKTMYKRKKDIMMEAMGEYFPEGLTWTKPEGGMFTWVTLPEHMDSRLILMRAIKEYNVAFVIGGAFYFDGTGSNHMRLNFSHSSDDLITEGIKRLGATLKKEME
ncbi:MAG: PLP-dependent aminotransferase family protein [Thermoplasmata archaeon]|nr:MAG: PLP-dependent aminotransferase family protein [Thermoplasmata archaeon]